MKEEMIYKIIYSSFYIGVFMLCFSNFIEITINAYKKKRRLEKLISNKEDAYKEGIMKHLHMLLWATTKSQNYKNIKAFFMVSIACGICSFVMIYYTSTLFIAFISGVVMTIFPYIILKVKLQRLRVNSSKEGDLLVSTLLNNYKICHYNMKLAIEKTALELQRAPNSKIIMMNLSKGLNNATSEKDVERNIENMKYALDTTWGNVLGSNVYFGEILGLKVTTSLNDLLVLIKNSRKLMEFEKRQNNEGALMLKIMVPICYIFSVVAANTFFDFSISKFIQYQFFAETGIFWFCLVCLTYCAGLLMYVFVCKRKMDV